MIPLSFSAFAERCEQRATAYESSPAGFAMALINLPQDLREAARHARLLERIEQWAKTSAFYDTGLADARAEVLRLLREDGK